MCCQNPFDVVALYIDRHIGLRTVVELPQTINSMNPRHREVYRVAMSVLLETEQNLLRFIQDKITCYHLHGTYLRTNKASRLAVGDVAHLNDSDFTEAISLRATILPYANLPHQINTATVVQLIERAAKLGVFRYGNATFT